ncbi:MAG: DEAD/DEAH box helicase [Candidatus Micrarchaeota archaeon]|nr:DEAD/DEAH box helicase [Candidatus Micrarchaeota archaeon]
MKFEEMGLSAPVMKALQGMGFETATPIQEQAVPLLMQGEDLIGQAKTGTGKTAAFGLPIFERYLHEKATDHRHFQPGRAMPMALILCPTRELAIQVSTELGKMGQFTGAHIVALYGGQDIERQIRSFGRPVDIIVGTPGRVLDHLDRNTLELAGVHVAVLDEADRMLDMGFIDDIVAILGQTPRSRQTLLFSATMPREIMNVAAEYMKSPQTIKVSEDTLTVDKIKQSYLMVDAPSRLGFLLGLLKVKQPKLAMIFVRTKHGADKLMYILRDRGYAAAALHGNLTQGQRDRAMRDFREGKLHVMVATDLASRGLDVIDVSHVINYDLPEEPMTYVHRIGRTGRMGAEGEAISLVFPDQTRWLEDIVQQTGAPIERIQIEPDRSRGPAPGGPREGGHEGRGGFGREGGRPHGGGFGQREGGHGGGYSHSRPREGGYGGREGGRSGGFGGREGGRRFGGDRGGRGRDGDGPRGGGVSGMTMRKIKQRARQPARPEHDTRGGHHYVGRDS